MTNIENYVIIGNGAAGYYAANTIRKNNSTASIKIISAEKYLTYYRPQLSEYLYEEIPEKKFYLSPDSWYVDNNIDLQLGTFVTEIHTAKKVLKLEDGSKVNYDKLILANGSSNFIPPIKGTELEGVYTLKYKNDADKIKEAIKSSKKAVVIGGGLLGLEAAWEMKKSGLQVTVVEFFPRLLPRQLDDAGSELFKNIVNSSGVDIILGDCAEEIISQDTVSKVSALRLKSGKLIDADLVLFSAGIRPNKTLAEKSGILCHQAIVVNEKMETNVKDIYACGDVAEINGIVYGTWPAAMEMGKVAGKNATGEDSKFKEFSSSVIFRGLNAEVFSAGTIDFNDASLKQFAQEDSSKKIYKKLFFKDGILAGAILIGDTKKAAKVISGMKKMAGEEIVNEILV
ncbi:NAD(P)/FAD-dependent oxidoreductase [Clostridium thermarum]|uniref:NAD(P)/FAD-dependent oxidoreductase n=1 Tax=Clostridium thermarum TaxID=1716543 RepID=UPI0013D1B7F8|nr:FAD-dependent oxidoreductase [Clostridium thermarum]